MSYLYECRKLAAAGDFGGTGPADGQLTFEDSAGAVPIGVVPFIFSVGCRVLNTCTMTMKLQRVGGGNDESFVLFSGSGQWGSSVGIRVPTLRTPALVVAYRLQFSTSGKTTDGAVWCHWTWALDDAPLARF